MIKESVETVDSRWAHTYGNEKELEAQKFSPFVKFILKQLGDQRNSLTGLYAGNVSGNNYGNLLLSRANVYGFDKKNERAKEIKEKIKIAENKVSPIDLKNYTAAGIFHYVIGEEIFQIGGKNDLEQTFLHAHQALLPHGRLILNLNSISTPVEYAHEKLDHGKNNGQTLVHTDGTQAGEHEYFYTQTELRAIAEILGMNVLKMTQTTDWEAKIHAVFQKS